MLAFSQCLRGGEALGGNVEHVFGRETRTTSLEMCCGRPLNQAACVLEKDVSPSQH